MAILYRNECCNVLDHGEYISKLYKRVQKSNDKTVSYRYLPDLFSIIGSNKLECKRKRKRDSDNIIEETMLVKQMYLQLLKQLPPMTKDKINQLKTSDTNSVRDLSKRLFESTVFEFNGLTGGNDADQALKCTVREEGFLVPQNCRFHCGCVKEQCMKLQGKKFQLVVADPPWWNKYIRRLKAANDKLSYSMMYNEDIASIPVKELLADNCLIVVWCTNAASSIAAVKELLFPKWGVEYVTTWYWLKVTTDFQPLCDFGAGSQKQPYERMILGRVGDMTVPHNQLVVSVPSGLHSHKPPLLDLLSPYLMEENPQTLELFARYLLPNTTSVGYEPLKWQHLSLYETLYC